MKSIFATLLLWPVLSWSYATLISDERGYRAMPSDVQSFRLSYSFNNLEVPAGATIELMIPPEFVSRTMDFVYLTHKQDPRFERECFSRSNGVVIWDCMPGYTSFEVLDTNSKDHLPDWRYWGGAGSGPYNSKFAEVRGGWGETDNLYEWSHYGHYSVATNAKSYAPIVPAKFRVRSVGRDSIILQEVVVKFAPPAPSRMEEIIFANGLVFGDFETAQGRRYPGHASAGDYGFALDLNPRFVPRHRFLPPNWGRFDGEIQIPMESDTPLSFIDVACGDMKPVPTGEEAEHYRGGSHLNIFVIHANGKRSTLMSKENVGTTGVMRVPLSPENEPVLKGDVIAIRASEDSLRVMGIRFGFK